MNVSEIVSVSVHRGFETSASFRNRPPFLPPVPTALYLWPRQPGDAKVFDPVQKWFHLEYQNRWIQIVLCFRTQGGMVTLTCFICVIFGAVKCLNFLVLKSRPTPVQQFMVSDLVSHFGTQGVMVESILLHSLHVRACV